MEEPEWFLPLDPHVGGVQEARLVSRAAVSRHVIMVQNERSR